MSDVSSDEDMKLQLEMLKLKMKKKKEKEERQKSLAKSTASNDDKIIIEKFHGGVATKAILPNLKNYAKQELLSLPDDIKLYSNSVPTQASHKVYQTFKESSNFVSSFMSSKFTQENSIGFKIPLFGASLGLNKESSSSSGSSNSNAQSNSSSNREMSVVIYEYISKGSFDLPPGEIVLSKAAERRVSRINSLKDAFDFFDEFGAFYPVCTYTVGGIYMCEVQASGKSSSNMNEFSSSASSAVSSKISGSIGFGGFELSGGKGSSSASESGGSQRNASGKGDVNVEIKCLNHGPQHINIEDFRKAINQNRNEWTNIGCNLTKLKPIYEIIKDTDKDELNNAVFYLNVAHIVKNLENSMVNQIVKKFENENKKQNFDIDLFLTCLSKEIQEVAIEEFAKMSNGLGKSDDIFKKFEKWMKQVYNNAVNQNLDIVQKLIDIGLEFPDSTVQLNNIYFENENESKFAFILYYTDKFKRLDFEGWNDLLECMKNLKDKNENAGRYVLCNLDLHHEVDDVEEMCLNIYYEGKQKKLMHINQDFLEHHGINFGALEISLSEKAFTYYIEDDIFTKYKNVKSFIFTESNLRIIREKSFTGLMKLENVSLSENKIRLIEDKSFINLKGLKNLDLSDNKIDIINEQTFAGLRNLKALLLYSNLIKSLNNSAFAQLTNLIALVLDNNQIGSIEKDTFKGLVNLAILKLNNNKISAIEDFSFSDLKKLKKLTLSKNTLTELTDDVFSGLENLRTLDLKENSISDISKKAFNPLLKNLKSINIDENVIDADILKEFKFQSLTDMHVQYDSDDDEAYLDDKTEISHKDIKRDIEKRSADHDDKSDHSDNDD